VIGTKTLSLIQNKNKNKMNLLLEILTNHIARLKQIEKFMFIIDEIKHIRLRFDDDDMYISYRTFTYTDYDSDLINKDIKIVESEGNILNTYITGTTQGIYNTSLYTMIITYIKN
jgi:hypothetical protein